MSTELPIYQVDAFTGRPFTGNPAAVCPLETWLSDALMQAIAAENNLSETAFFVREGDGYRLRWFTPTTEVDLCGHATLASALVLFAELGHREDRVRFATRSGPLSVRRATPADGLADGALVMDLPSRPPRPVAAPATLAQALGEEPAAVLAARDLVAVLEDAAAVRRLRPDLALVAGLPYYGLIVTAPGSGPDGDGDVDFVSRFFAPKQGVPEDPVTGSAHATLCPYWSERLGKRRLSARQVSPRGGELTCTQNDERVELGGLATLVLRGHLLLP